MTQAGLLARPERGRYLLTERGRKVLQDYPDRVDMTVLSQFPEYQEFRARKSEKQLEPSRRWSRQASSSGRRAMEPLTPWSV